jgi:hypothetical protein
VFLILIYEACCPLVKAQTGASTYGGKKGKKFICRRVPVGL